MFKNFDYEVADKVVSIRGKCRSCTNVIEFTVSTEGFNDYFQNGKKVQDAFPTLTSAQREYLISGICDQCFNRMFPPDQE
jgi:DNA polymerase II large subunit